MSHSSPEITKVILKYIPHITYRPEESKLLQTLESKFFGELLGEWDDLYDGEIVHVLCM